MKTKNLFFGLLLGASVCACTNDDSSPVNNEWIGGEEAYLTISLANAGAGQRSYEVGIKSENDVKSAEFYFYNADGTFHSLTSNNLSWETPLPTTGNIEKIADATVVLRNLKEKGTPKYVVAVLNAEPQAYTDLSLSQLEAKLLENPDAYKYGGYFTITNSTYNNENSATKYFAAVIEDKNFLREPPKEDDLTDDNAVKIHVERIAAKARVGFASGKDPKKIVLANYEVDGVKKDIELEVLAWGLNAVNKQSYVMKKVPAWSTDLDFTWDVNKDFRSLWALSPNYGVAATTAANNYPNTFASTVKDPGTGTPIETINTDTYALKYISWNSLTADLTTPLYCLENTNTAAILNAEVDETRLGENGNFNAKATHFLLKAQVKGGTDLVRFDNQIFTGDGFMKRVLNKLNNNMDMWKVTQNDKGETVYTPINTTDLEVVNMYDGHVILKLNAAAKAATWSSTADKTTALAVSYIENKLAEIFDSEDDWADYYKNGMMYYYIPIKHLRPIATGQTGVLEANYGVVRNHLYDLTINDIVYLGTAVYDPDEEIVPNKEKETYYVGAKVSILSWKVVSYGAEL